MMKKLTLGHSPDSDDAFMFYALAEGKIETEGLTFEHVIEDIESLNRRAEKEELDITALSVHAYAHVADRYRLLRSGASMGEGYGPIVISRCPLSPTDLPRKKIAIPGRHTSAWLSLQLCIGSCEYEVVPFDEIMPRVARGDFEAGLLIHEGQLTWENEGFHLVLDLGRWWEKETGLPLPLGVNAVGRNLPEETQNTISRILQRTIRYGLEHRTEGVAHALRYARGLEETLTDRFVGMYVNEITLDFGERGENAIREFLGRAARVGIIPGEVPIDPVIPS